ncbi:hypothetical protein [Azospirillum largimobile]
MSALENKSKTLAGADDSAARLLKELLDGSPGRNFDVESLFVEKLSDGSWKFVIFEFLKADSIPPENSHPNYYWFKNKRKFLSLWALAKALRRGGFHVDLLLVNYDDARTKVKIMKVNNVDENSTDVIRAARTNQYGQPVSEIRRWVDTDDEIMSFSDFKSRFKNYNNNKNGDTWELLGIL